MPSGELRPSGGSRETHASYWARLVPALRLWIILVVLIGGVGLFMRLTENFSPWLDVISSLAMLVVVLAACWPARRQLKPLLSGFGLAGLRLLEPLAALAVLAGFMWAYFGLLEMLQVSELRVTDCLSEFGWPLWTAYLTIGLAPAFVEELAFRGLIQSKLEDVGGKNEALVIQAVMFSFLHLLPTIFISHFFIGLVLGTLRLRSGSLYPGMLVHAAWNIFVICQETHQF